MQVSYRGSQLNDLGMLVDFKVLKSELGDIVSYMDHTYLNELPEFQQENPTAENIARTIFEKMRTSIGDGIFKVTVWETPTSSASYQQDITN